MSSEGTIKYHCIISLLLKYKNILFLNANVFLDSGERGIHFPHDNYWRIQTLSMKSSESRGSTFDSEFP